MFCFFFQISSPHLGVARLGGGLITHEYMYIYLTFIDIFIDIPGYLLICIDIII